MSTTMVQIRNVPVDLHRRLKARAAIEGMTTVSYTHLTLPTIYSV